MADKTVSLNKRQVNLSLRTRLQANNYQLQRKKVELEAEMKYSNQQMDMKQRALQEKLRKLRLRQQVTSAFMAPTAKPKEDTQDVKDPKPGTILQPLEDVVNPYPITFESSGRRQSHSNPEKPISKSLPRLPFIPQGNNIKSLVSPRNPRRQWRKAAEQITRKYTF